MKDFILVIFIISTPFILYFLYLLIGHILQRKRWHVIDKETFSLQMEDILIRSFYPYRFLSIDEKKRLNKKILYFLKYKNFVPLGEFPINEQMKLYIAAQACLLIMNLDVEVYPHLTNIYITLSTYFDKKQDINPHTMSNPTQFRLGESWHRGPIVLAADAIESGLFNWKDGHNVVLHEFTHQLDSHSGQINGIPFINDINLFRRWNRVMNQEYADLKSKVHHHHKSDIDYYGATNGAEFFAVTVEEFFEKPIILRKNHFELFELYQNFFKINPLLWFL